MKKIKNENRFYVYELIDPRPYKNKEVIYVGKGTNRRMKSHMNNVRNGKNATNKLLTTKLKAILNAGFDDIVADKLLEEDAIKLERKTGEKYPFEQLCNMAPFEGSKCTGGWKHTEEWKRKQSERFSGERNPAYGKTYCTKENSPEWHRNVSEAVKRVSQLPERRKKLSESLLKSEKFKCRYK